MLRFRIIAMYLVLAAAVAGAFSATSFAGAQDTKTVEGTVICLIPDYQKGTVTPVIATGPCNGLPPHQHVLMTEDGTVYSLQGLQDGLMKVALMPKKTDVTMTGQVQGNTYGWVLFVN